MPEGSSRRHLWKKTGRRLAALLLTLITLLMAGCSFTKQVDQLEVVIDHNGTPATVTEAETSVPHSGEEAERTRPRPPPPASSASEQTALTETDTSFKGTNSESKGDGPAVAVVKGQPYYTKTEVAAYLHQFAELPPNYLTKREAKRRGWLPKEGNLWEVTNKGCIGGDHFGNREGRLPQRKGQPYFECDVNYHGGHRGAERLLYTKDGWIYYTGDHYKTFEELYRGRE